MGSFFVPVLVDEDRVAEVAAEDADHPAQESDQHLGRVLTQRRGGVVSSHDVDHERETDQRSDHDHTAGEDERDNIGGSVDPQSGRPASSCFPISGAPWV